MLTQFDRTLGTTMETDSRNQAHAGILSQYHIVNGAKQLHALEYYAKTVSTAQRHWCKVEAYRVYSFVTTSQDYPNILSCDLNNHVS